eukprot:m.58076 g.58076  ORF g.58076 m.58076 type:complete len:63 (+) comp13120_c0_seq1:458-646(+)
MHRVPRASFVSLYLCFSLIVCVCVLFFFSVFVLQTNLHHSIPYCRSELSGFNRTAHYTKKCV